MRIKWNRDVELEIIENYDEEHDRAVTVIEHFKQGEESEIDVFGGNPKHEVVDIQFGDGSCALGVSENWYDVI